MVFVLKLEWIGHALWVVGGVTLLVLLIAARRALMAALKTALDAGSLLLAAALVGLDLPRAQAVAAAGGMIVLGVLRRVLTLVEERHLTRALDTAQARIEAQARDLEQMRQEKNEELRERRRIEERLSHDALHDALTGLPNRALFLDRLAQAGKRRQRDANYRYAVLYLDLDGFKLINDSLGHPFGDRLLAEIARLLIGLMRATDTVARLGGDEFGILLDDVHSTQSIRTAAARVLTELNRPITLDGQTVFITASIGVVDCGTEPERPEDILRDADLAMYQAKARGRARYEIFDVRARSQMIERLALVNELRQSIEAGNFELYYQPILQLPTRRLIGFEALVRWRHPERGVMPPAAFIPIAEETGLIIPLGRWVLFEACREAARWQQVYPAQPPLKVNVNISAIQFKQPDFILTVTQALEQARLAGDSLVLEVTESACLGNLEKVAILITSLKGMKVEVQIDDFGAGYSSLSYLHRLPVNKIKIDRSFIQTIEGEDTPDMVRAILSLVNTMGIPAVAEGIETEPQANAMLRLNCAYVQGYWFARPMPRDAILRWIQDHQHEFL